MAINYAQALRDINTWSTQKPQTAKTEGKQEEKARTVSLADLFSGKASTTTANTNSAPNTGTTLPAASTGSINWQKAAADLGIAAKKPTMNSETAAAYQAAAVDPYKHAAAVDLLAGAAKGGKENQGVMPSGTAGLKQRAADLEARIKVLQGEGTETVRLSQDEIQYGKQRYRKQYIRQKEIDALQGELDTLQRNLYSRAYADVFSGMDKDLQGRVTQSPEWQRQQNTEGEARYRATYELQALRKDLADRGYTKEQIDGILEYARQQYNAGRVTEAREKARESAETRVGVGNWAVNVGTGLAQGAQEIDILLQNIARIGKEDPYTGMKTPVDYNTQTAYAIGQGTMEGQQQKVLDKYLDRFDGDEEKAQKRAQMSMDFYQLATSMGESAAIVGLSALGVPAATVILGSSAATATTMQYHEAGYSDTAALGMGLIAGAVEAITEKYSVEKLLDAPGKLAGKQGREWLMTALKNTAGQMLAEGSEEVAADVLNTLADTILLGDKSQYEAGVKSLMDSGMSREEAEKKAFTDWILNTAKSGAMGAISGGIFGAGGSLVGTAFNSLRGDSTVQSNAQSPQNETTPAAPQNAVQSDSTGQTGAESTSVNTNPAQHTQVEQNIIDDYQNSTDNGLVEFMQKSITGEKADPYELKPVSERAATDIKRITGVDTAGNRTYIEDFIARHIFNRHGPSGTADHSMRDLNDFGRIQYVLDNYDIAEQGKGSSAYRDSKNKASKSVVFKKAVNGTYYVVEAVPDTKAHTAYIVSARMEQNNAGATRATNAEASVSTAEPNTLNAPVNITLSQSSPAVNSAVDLFFPQQQEQQSNPTDSGDSAPMGSGDAAQTGGRPNFPPTQPGGDGTKVSETAQTVREAQATPEEFQPLIDRMVEKGGFSFIPITNDETVQQAVNTITQKGWEQARADWKADVKTGHAGEQISAVGALLYNHAVNAGDTRAALDILSDYQAMLRTTARGLQAARILQNLTPDSRLYMIQKQITNLNEELKLPEGVKLNEDLAKRFLEAESEQERNDVIKQIQKDIAAQIPARWFKKDANGKTELDWDSIKAKWTALRYVNMLGNFKTQVRNIAGNTAMGMTVRMKDALAAGMELFLPKEERTKSLFVSSELKKAARADFANVEEVALGEGKYQENNAEGIMKGAMDQRRVFTSPVLGRAMELYRKGTNWAMEKGDVIFSKAAYAHALAGYLQARGITAQQFQQMTESGDARADEARAYAIREAQEATFRDSNAVSEWASKALRGEKTPKLIKFLGEGLMPFRKTPANILVRAWEYSPAGLISNTLQTAKEIKGNEFNGADFINRLAKNMTGTGLFALGMALRSMGRLRGGDEPDKEKQAFDELTGQQNYSFIMDDGSSFTLDWVAPDSIPLFMGVAFYDALQESGVGFKSIEKALTSLAEPMLQMSMLSGVNDALSNVKYSDNDLIQLAINSAVGYLTQGMTNTFVGQFERFSEDTRKTTWVDNDSDTPSWLQRVLGKSSAKTPGWDYQQRDYIDAWGRTQDTTGRNALDRIWNTFLNPSYTSQDRTTDVDRELERLFDAGYKVFPDSPDTATKVNDLQIGMEAQTQYNIDKGSTAYDLLEEMFGTSTYQTMTDEDKAKAIDVLYDYAKAAANGKAGSNKDAEKWVVNAYNANRRGGDAVGYMAMKALYGADMAGAYLNLTDAGVDSDTATAIVSMVERRGGPDQENVYKVIRELGLNDAGAEALWEAYAKQKGWTTSWADYVKKQEK